MYIDGAKFRWVDNLVFKTGLLGSFLGNERLSATLRAVKRRAVTRFNAISLRNLWVAYNPDEIPTEKSLQFRYTRDLVKSTTGGASLYPGRASTRHFCP